MNQWWQNWSIYNPTNHCCTRIAQVDTKIWAHSFSHHKVIFKNNSDTFVNAFVNAYFLIPSNPYNPSPSRHYIYGRILLAIYNYDIEYIGYCTYHIKLIYFHDFVYLSDFLSFNILRPRPNGRYFADDIFEFIFFYENNVILIAVSLKFAPDGPINNKPALLQTMAWHRTGNKALSETILA